MKEYFYGIFYSIVKKNFPKKMGKIEMKIFFQKRKLEERSNLPIWATHLLGFFLF
jgi:hypothetical protein